jgi:hypothetical protein
VGRKGSDPAPEIRSGVDVATLANACIGSVHCKIMLSRTPAPNKREDESLAREMLPPIVLGSEER